MSVFTFDHDPPRVASPWLHASAPEKTPESSESNGRTNATPHRLLSDYGVTKLEPEPQEGPIEYKLHLLLRSRRQYLHMSTTNHHPSSARNGKALQKPNPAPASSNQSRQERLLSLTTQLLWRLEQSAPYHTKISDRSIPPLLASDNFDASKSVQIGSLVAGLEDSRGALYEIGVADDGTLIGLAEDELGESVHMLRLMAGSLGCTVRVLKTIAVGDCAWLDYSALDGRQPSDNDVKRGQLWVAEALVAPDLSSRSGHTGPHAANTRPRPAPSAAKEGALTSSQLRITLTGPSRAGKSTLLGTLSTGMLDNGRGANRLTLFKHQHERKSGVTSSISQELIGYRDNEIYTYLNKEGIEPWERIHALTQDGRLAFVTDCAGLPQYRRTIMRGLVGWAPHWTFLCLTAPDLLRSPSQDPVSTAPDDPDRTPRGIDLGLTYLSLCLKLNVPLVIVVTKSDLITRLALKTLLRKVYDMIQLHDRRPRPFLDQTAHEDISKIPRTDEEKIVQLTDTIANTGDHLSLIPVVLTSALKGIGIGTMHSLLKHLPCPPTPTAYDLTGKVLNPEQPACLFHIDDRFSLPASHDTVSAVSDQSTDRGTVVAGYLRFGKLAVGDKILVGPFSSIDEDGRGLVMEDKPSPSPGGALSLSHPLSATELSRLAARNTVPASKINGEWYNATIESIRNLRLNVQTLEAGQAGTIGIILTASGEAELPDSPFERPPLPTSKIRKGMVLAVPSKHMVDSGLSLQAASGLTMQSHDPAAGQLTAGSLVNVYIATIRASARVARVARACLAEEVSDAEIDVFNLQEQDGSQTPTDDYDVQLELLSHREWIELGSRILILEGGRNDRTGLEGIVGKVVEIVD
jgi:GTPase